MYITTAIPYANAKPHVGNAMDYLYADIWARYQRQNGRDVRFQVGTDEHGNKIAAKAQSLNMTPQNLVDSLAPEFDKMATTVGAEYTDFIRTSDPKHQVAVQQIWQKIEKYIYKDTYEGWYCVGSESFVTDKEAAANGGISPDHQQPYQRLSEENYYFKTSAFTDAIREALESGKVKIYPEFRKKEFLELIKDGLNDVSVSRPRKNLSWGVSVPGDESQVMYVWMDALCNYLTVLGYPNNEAFQEHWPADVQVIGKDITRFHLGIWLSILLALELPLPKAMLIHGFVTVDGAKMSKTVGNVVDPIEIIESYGQDAFRYYFTRHIPTQGDGDFTWEKFEKAYNGELGNDLGNLVSRVAAMINRYQSGVIGDVPDGEHDIQPYRKMMDSLRFDGAIDEVWNVVRALNQYLEQVKPWEIAKRAKEDPEEEEHLSEVLAHCVGGLRQVADMLHPILPTTAAAIDAIFTNETITAGANTALFPKKYLHTPDPRAPKGA